MNAIDPLLFGGIFVTLALLLPEDWKKLCPRSSSLIKPWKGGIQMLTARMYGHKQSLVRFADINGNVEPLLAGEIIGQAVVGVAVDVDAPSTVDAAAKP